MHVKVLAESNELPDYRMAFNQEADTVTFYAYGQKGGTGTVREFRRKLKGIAETQHRPDYEVTLQEDMATFRPRYTTSNTPVDN